MSREFSFIGPPLSEGPLPALFYFALSANDSLHLDPFNQPVAFLSHYPLRIFSMTLPGHGEGMPATEALTLWANAIQADQDPISPFIDRVVDLISRLQDQNLILSDQLAVAGLSRGGFIAAHVAARAKNIRSVLGFAPLTSLAAAKEFRAFSHPLIEALHLSHLTEKLVGKHVRFYIGNRDERVGTDLCFQWIRQLTEVSFQHRIRSPRVELILTPSIGHQGHGTSPETFQAGARWILKELGISHD